MKSQFYKVVDAKGRVLIPFDLRKEADIEDNDIVRMCMFNKMVILERVEIQPEDMVQKLKNSLGETEKSTDAVLCYVLAALGGMEKERLEEIHVCVEKLLNK